MVRIRDREAVYSAAERFKEVALEKDDSLFTPGVPIWSKDPAQDLHERFVKHPDESSDRFEVKLQRQLAGAPAKTCQLMGELLYIHFLVAENVHLKRKSQLIETVLSWSPKQIKVPEDLFKALAQGLLTVGMAFHTLRPFQIQFLLEFLLAWKALDAGKQRKYLSDPWAFKEFVMDVPIKGAYMQRDALLHLIYPDTLPFNSESRACSSFWQISSLYCRSSLANSFHS